MEVLQIADVSHLWLTVEVFEDQLAWIQEGSEVAITLSYFSGHEFRGKVRFVEPQVSVKTRSVRVSLEVPNPERRLRAGMYATATFAPVVASDAIVVSDQALLRTGERDVVVVATGNGRFEPRAVVLGPSSGGRIQVLEGLHAGETIVTSAQFLFDSESNLQAAIQRLIAGHAH
jgi:RND family efflux transporter MFP subunit